MPGICPKPCSRLAVAAVFISVGVVQLLAGIILLRSKYAELLSGPDFMTASSNIGIGCVFGIASSVWNTKKKQKTKKLAARNNVLAALLMSIISVNTTTSAVLIMGDGNKLLSLYMETEGYHKSAAFANEVLAGAYVTSVCSPIVCIVVAIVSLSGNCFQVYNRRKQMKNDILGVESPFGWVYDPKARSQLSVVSNILETPTASQRSKYSEDNVFPEDGSSSLRQNIERNIPTPVSTRAHILGNAALLKKRAQLFDSYIPDPVMLQNQNVESIPRGAEFSNIKKQLRSCSVHMSPRRSVLISEGQKRNSVESVSFETDFEANLYKNYHAALNRERIGLHHDSRSKDNFDNANGKKINASHGVERPDGFEANFRQDSIDFRNETPPISVNTNYDVNTKNNYSQKVLDPIVNASLTKLKFDAMKELKARMQKISSLEPASFETRENDTPPGILKHHERANNSNVPRPPLRNSSSVKDVSYSEDYTRSSDTFENKERRYFAETGRKYSDERMFANRNEHTSENFSKFVSVSDHSRPHSNTSFNKTNRAVINNLKSINSKVFDFSQTESELLNEVSDSEATSLPLLNNDANRKFKNLVLDCPKITSIKMQNRKRDAALRMSSMSSITESPSEEAINEDIINRTFTVESSRRCSSVSAISESSVIRDENSNITEIPVVKGISSNRTRSRKFSANASFKKLLNRMWSTASPETKLNLSEFIVDEDSLIGLSKEELIARTLRIRSLRKAVEDRLKNEVENREVEG